MEGQKQEEPVCDSRRREMGTEYLFLPEAVHQLSAG